MNDFPDSRTILVQTDSTWGHQTFLGKGSKPRTASPWSVRGSAARRAGRRRFEAIAARLPKGIGAGLLGDAWSSSGAKRSSFTPGSGGSFMDSQVGLGGLPSEYCFSAFLGRGNAKSARRGSARTPHDDQLATRLDVGFLGFFTRPACVAYATALDKLAEKLVVFSSEGWWL